MKTTFRTKVFKRAYELMKLTGDLFEVCLSRAWAIYRLTKRMKKEVVTFSYKKADGAIRKAKGTLKDVQDLIKGTGKANYKAIRYYDTEVSSFRSFRIENLVSIN